MYLYKLLPSDHFKFVQTRTYKSTKWQIHNICLQQIYVRIPWQVSLDNKHCEHNLYKPLVLVKMRSLAYFYIVNSKLRKC